LAPSLDFVKAMKKKKLREWALSRSRVAQSIWSEVKGELHLWNRQEAGVAMEQNKKSIDGNEQIDVHHPKRFLPPHLGPFDLKADFLRTGEGELNVSRSGIQGNADRRLMMIHSALFAICRCLAKILMSSARIVFADICTNFAMSCRKISQDMTRTMPSHSILIVPTEIRCEPLSGNLADQTARPKRHSKNDSFSQSNRWMGFCPQDLPTFPCEKIYFAMKFRIWSCPLLDLCDIMSHITDHSERLEVVIGLCQNRRNSILIGAVNSTLMGKWRRRRPRLQLRS
jgi:hypothetical protein